MTKVKYEYDDWFIVAGLVITHHYCPALKFLVLGYPANDVDLVD
jgi:hypothetical protein